jgi:hypothetical protein
MQEERQYIRDEARSLFKKNKDLQTEAEVVAAITEAKSRLDLAFHYKIPYPRFLACNLQLTNPRPFNTSRMATGETTRKGKKDPITKPAYMLSYYE